MFVNKSPTFMPITGLKIKARLRIATDIKNIIFKTIINYTIK